LTGSLQFTLKEETTKITKLTKRNRRNLDQILPLLAKQTNNKKETRINLTLSVNKDEIGEKVQVVK
jgi:hypothetical protein